MNERPQELKQNDQGMRIVPCSAPGCDAEIVFAITLNDRPIPLDPEPNEQGNTAVEDRGQRFVAHTFSGRNLLSMRQRMREGGSPLYMPHHATCKDVAHFRG